MFNSTRKSELPFKTAGDIRLDLFRWHAVVKRSDDHHRNVDVRKHVNRHAHESRPAQNGDDQCDDHDEVGRLDGETRHNFP